MDIVNAIKELVEHLIFFIIFFITATIVGFIILSMVMWDCLIFIVNKTGELLWLKK